MASNTVLPVINAPPISPEWASQDIWSSLRMPSGVGCTTVLSADEAALAAAKNFASSNDLVYSKLLAFQLNNVGKILVIMFNRVQSRQFFRMRTAQSTKKIKKDVSFIISYLYKFNKVEFIIRFK